MTPTLTITLGSKESWADPQPVRMGLSDDLVIYNIETVSWPIRHGGRVDRAAYFLHGQWFPLKFSGQDVRAGDGVSVPAGGLRLDITPNWRFSRYEQRRLPSMRQRRLSSMRELCWGEPK